MGTGRGRDGDNGNERPVWMRRAVVVAFALTIAAMVATLWTLRRRALLLQAESERRAIFELVQ